jgi:hypothetical protein
MDIPEWMKPNEVNAIIDIRDIDGIPYLSLKEAGSILRSDVLTWVIQYGLNNNFNIYWQVDGSSNYIGSSEFVTAMKKNTF